MCIQISIILPVYNVAPYIKYTLNSIKTQNFTAFECIIINDGSTDKTLDIIYEYIQNDFRFKIYSTKHLGVSSARNLGIQKASGKYICFLDGDDQYDVYFLRELYIKSQNKNSFLAFSDVLYSVSPEVLKIIEYIPEDCTVVFPERTLWKYIFRKDLILAHNIQFKPINRHEDALFIYDYYFSNNIKTIEFASKAIYKHRLYRLGSLTNTTITNTKQYLKDAIPYIVQDKLKHKNKIGAKILYNNLLTDCYLELESLGTNGDN